MKYRGFKLTPRKQVRHPHELYRVLNPFLATQRYYSKVSKFMTTARMVEFVPEERRPVVCWLPIKWMPQLDSSKGWVRLTYEQFCRAYQLVQVER